MINCPICGAAPVIASGGHFSLVDGLPVDVPTVAPYLRTSYFWVEPDTYSYPCGGFEIGFAPDGKPYSKHLETT